MVTIFVFLLYYFFSFYFLVIIQCLRFVANKRVHNECLNDIMSYVRGDSDGAVEIVNNWVAEKTNNKITKLVSADDVDELSLIHI